MVTAQEETDTFAKARASFEEMLCWLEGTESAALTHAELEDQVERRGREVQRLMFQDHLDLRALREDRVRVVDAVGIVMRPDALREATAKAASDLRQWDHELPLCQVVFVGQNFANIVELLDNS